MRLRISVSTVVMILAAVASADEPRRAEIVFKSYYQGLPDLQSAPPFADLSPEQATALRKIVQRNGEGRECAPSAGGGPQELCPKAVVEVRELLGPPSSGASADQMTHMWVTELGRDSEPELLVQYDHELGEGSDRYAALLAFRWTGSAYSLTASRWFLQGAVHAIEPFGPDGSSTVFVRTASCTECHPWVYLLACRFLGQKVVAFEFDYDPGKGGAWQSEIEYRLPGGGHSIDAEVETRLPTASARAHLLQHFSLEGGKDEWWEFTCVGQRCGTRIFEEELPPAAFLEQWSAARPI